MWTQEDLIRAIKVFAYVEIGDYILQGRKAGEKKDLTENALYAILLSVAKNVSDQYAPTLQNQKIAEAVKLAMQSILAQFGAEVISDMISGKNMKFEAKELIMTGIAKAIFVYLGDYIIDTVSGNQASGTPVQ